MRYAKNHKHDTRRRMLVSACSLFAAKGFDAVAIDDVMRDCALTRGGFYAHFASKGELYRQAIEFGLTNGYLSIASSDRLPRSSLHDRIDTLIDESIGVTREHSARANGDRNASRFAFLAIDTAVKDPNVRGAYALAIRTLSDQLENEARANRTASDAVIASVIAMIIGAVSMARVLRDTGDRARLVASCKQAVNSLFAAHESAATTFFWEGARGTDWRRDSLRNEPQAAN